MSPSSSATRMSRREFAASATLRDPLPGRPAALPGRLVGGPLGRRPRARALEHADAERRPLPGLALDLDRRFVGVDDRLHDRQAEAGALDVAPLRLLGAIHAVEQVAQIGLVDADAGIGDPEPQAVALMLDRDLYAAALGRELDRVRDQVLEDLAQAVRVGLRDDARRAGAAGLAGGP